MSKMSAATCISANGHSSVLHLVETLEVGGTETQLLQTALRQHSRQQNVTVGCLRAEGPLLASLERAGIPVVEFRKGKKLLSLQGVTQCLRLAFFLRRREFHVMHAHDLMSSLLGVPAARLAGTPVVISSRRYLADLDWWRGELRNRVARVIYNSSTHVVVNSKSIRDLLIARDGVRRERIRVIYNGVDADGFIRIRGDRGKLLSGVPRSSKIVVVVANMDSAIKGHASLIAAAGNVLRCFPDVTFVLIGEGQQRPRLQQQVKEASLGRNVLFLGSRKDIPELLSCCDLSIHPSESEGLPNALLEAMAAGLPVIATSVGGVPEVVLSEVHGLLVPPGDPDSLSAAILRVLKDEGLGRRLARAGRQRVIERFGFERLIDALETLYQDSPKPSGAHKKVFQTVTANGMLADQVNE